MYTQCPQCRTIFEIDENALQASLGIVRCGHCAERFDALRTLSDTLPTEPDATLPEHDPDVLAPTLTSAVSAEAVQAAARSARPWAASPSGNDSATQPGEAWFDALAGDRARALIADAAGIPPEAIQGDAGWQLADVPVQTQFAELDIIPMAAGETAMGNSVPDIPAPAAVDSELAESEPFTQAWGLDVADLDVAETAPSAESLASDEIESLMPQHTPAEFVDDPGIAVPLAPDVEPDPDAWLPEDELQAGDGLMPHADTAAEERSASTEPQNEAASGEAESAEPVYIPPRRRIRRSDGLWALGCVVLALALAAQLAWASRVTLVRDPATQAQALRVCARIDCRLPPIRDIGKLELLSRDIRPDPGAAGALAITATFRNNAPYRQPWPVVVVELTDLDNNVVAMRRFRPVEYMPDPVRRAAGITPGATAAVAFEVADPGKRAVSFHFGFD
ncbi:MAG: zinc-ribbon and DUF3426 domain-containing protein [Pseudomonadota bacterium]